MIKTYQNKDEYTLKFKLGYKRGSDMRTKLKEIIILDYAGRVVGRRKPGFIGRRDRAYFFHLPGGDTMEIRLRREFIRGPLQLSFYSLEGAEI